jgi:hypothetical protein
MAVTIHAADLASPHDPQQSTRALQDAIDQAATRGGVVEVGPGEYTVSTLHLRSGLTFRLLRGAVLKAHTDLADYPTLARGHNKDRQPFHLLHAENLEGLTIEGDGVIDGQGMAFWDPPRADAPGGTFWYRAKSQRISPLIELRHCRDVVLRDFVIRDSPGWTVHPYGCDRLTIRGITIANHLYGPNTDGLDINGCRDVFISDCDLTCGDDAIIIKSTDDARSCENIVVTNCILSSNCAVLGLGAEVTHAIRNVTFSNCVSRQALRIIQIEMWEAGLIENITFSNISGQTMTEVPLERPIYLDIQQHGRPDPALGTLRNVTISNFTATTRGRILLTAQDGAMIEDVTLRDVQLRYPQIEDASRTVPASRSSQMSNYNPHSRAINSVVVADNVRGLNLHNVSAAWPDQPAVGYHGLWCRNVQRGIVDCPHLRSSRPEVKTVVTHDSDLDLRAIG